MSIIKFICRYHNILFFLLGICPFIQATISLTLTLEEKTELAKKIRKNEGTENPKNLLWWNKNESFPSLGIGHFIWFPENYTGPFMQQFQDYLMFLHTRSVPLPTWLFDKNPKPCPWQTRQQFYGALANHDIRYKELEQLIIDTIPLQVDFIVERFVKSVNELFEAQVSDHQLTHRDSSGCKFFNIYRENSCPARPECFLSKQKMYRGKDMSGCLLFQHICTELLTSPAGRYALIDYVNFKGLGNSPRERYKNQGWGLIQVLEAMTKQLHADFLEQKKNDLTLFLKKQDLLKLFRESAEKMLQLRVLNALPEKDEHNFLRGWRNRIATYR